MGPKGKKYYYYLCKNKECRFNAPADEIEAVVTERIRQLAWAPEMIGDIVKTTNEKLQTDLPQLHEQKAVLEKELVQVKKTAEGLVEQWEDLATDDSTLFLKERLDELGKRRGQIERGLDEVVLKIEETERDALDQELVLSALQDFTEVFRHIAPYQQKELMRLVLHKAVLKTDSIELALYGRPPKLSGMTQGEARSETSDWLPG